MKISELIQQLQDIQSEHGDLSVMVVRPSVYQRSHLPPGAIGGGGYAEGYSREWYGTVQRLQVSDKYPDQLELIPAG